MAIRITYLGIAALARWLLAAIVVCWAVEIASAATIQPSQVQQWERWLQATAVLENVPAVSPPMASLLADAADGRLDSHRLFRAALVASRLDQPDRWRQYETRLEQWRATLAADPRFRGNELHQARVIHEYLHRHVFVGQYRDDATDLSCVLESGDYNCVSSVVCYLCLARQLGVKVRAVELPGHCRLELATNSGIVDLETTCPEWFEVLDDPSRSAAMLHQVTGFDGRRSQSRRYVTDTQLLGIIYYNRGVKRLAEQQYAASTRANLLALRIDPSNEIAHGNLLTTLNNWALDINQAGDYDEALDLLGTAIRIAPRHANFQTNEIHITQNWIEALLADGDWRQALDVADAAAMRRPEQAFYLRARWSILERQAESYLDENANEAAVTMLDMARSRYAEANELATIERGVWNRAAVARYEQGDYQAALSTLDFALTRQPDDDTLKRNRLAILSRWVEQAVRRRQFAQARQRARHATSDFATLSAEQRQLWRYCCEREMTYLAQATQTDAARERLADFQSLDPDHANWSVWQSRLAR